MALYYEPNNSRCALVNYAYIIYLYICVCVCVCVCLQMKARDSQGFI